MTYQDAAERINAVDNQDGTWTYEAKEDGNTYTLTGADLEALVEYLDRDPMDGYSLWCEVGYGELGSMIKDAEEYYNLD